jgi:hypothetical protein
LRKITHVLLSLLCWLVGYRKYTFRLFIGDTVTFRAWSRKKATKKALNLERRIRADQERIRANREHIIQTLMDEPIGRRAWDVPDELINDVLPGGY